MKNGLTRREFVGRVAAGVTVAGFVGWGAGGRWVTAAASGMAPVPPLDGTLVMDSQTLAQNSHDEGNIVTGRTPYAVLYPGSVQDIQKMVVYCCQTRIRE